MTSYKVWDPTYADNDVNPYDPSSVDSTLNQFHLLPHDKYNFSGKYTAHAASNLDANDSDEFDYLFPTTASNVEAISYADFDEFTANVSSCWGNPEVRAHDRLHTRLI